MIALSEEQYFLARQYMDLLETVEEAFKYIKESFNNLSYTEGDRLLSDIFHAFTQMINTNFVLAEYFKEQTSVLNSLVRFEAVVEKAEMLDGKFNDQNAKQKIILEDIHPAYSSWKLIVEQQLKPFIQV
ncbi:hypothetical protein [Cytobacillus oceanisediminis]|uniref:hypothetical protein n=1 Tax=Cytobacillus oceanisediminis TaxID=665099 RepID=UPI0011A82BF6|nr:hypothetical protein [Cytobacillus oceanisediminis]